MKEKYLLKLQVDKDYIENQILKRLEAKKLKDFQTADLIRSDLESKGIILNDNINGTVWDIKELY